MPWREVSVMDQRREFVRLAMQEGVNRRELCRRFGISPDVGYKWLARQRAGDAELADRSRRPHGSPRRSEAAIEAQVLAVRDAHPAWGARKIAHCLQRDGMTPPALSTVHEILRRAAGSSRRRARRRMLVKRFEKEAPNQLWQMDFKGHMPLANGAACHPLTMIDDHSRYALCIGACANEQSPTVQQQLTATFRRYGMPDAFFVDNGSPWGGSGDRRGPACGSGCCRLGVDVVYARPYHPQSRGKNERFHRTLKAEVFAMRRFRDLPELQRAFDAWRTVYNLERPHEALGMEVPPPLSTQPAGDARQAHRGRIPAVRYAPRLHHQSLCQLQGTAGRAASLPRRAPAIRPTMATDFAAGRSPLDLTAKKSVSDVSEQASAMSPD